VSLCFGDARRIKEKGSLIDKSKNYMCVGFLFWGGGFLYHSTKLVDADSYGQNSSDTHTELADVKMITSAQL